MNDQLIVNLGDRSYPIFIGENLLQKPSCFDPYISASQIVIVTNETVAPLYLHKLMATLKHYQPETIVLADGEQYKTLETANQVYTRLLQLKANRTITLIALGGGVIGDITGFVAATYQRGVNFIQVPTTLLSQVDSSVGGKTGVNHSLGKNMIGAFYQPKCVVADISTLKTLEPRQFSSGLAEVIKYGLIRDYSFSQWLQDHMQKLLDLDAPSLMTAVRRSCENKAAVVADDEKEKGQRALLNLGHTFGHAIETATHYKSWLHGEAIAAGMFMAARLSCDLGWINEADVKWAENQLLAANLPVRPPQNITTEKFLALMSVDKKVLDNKLRLVLLKALGSAVVTDSFGMPVLEKLLDSIERISEKEWVR